MLRENVERNFGFILNDVARLLRTTFDRRVRDLGLTRSQWWVLTHLFRNDGISQTALAEILEIERATLGRHLDRLEAKGWVRREPDPRDRRVKRVFLTDAADPSMRIMRTRAAELRADALRGLTRREQERFVDTLLVIKANLAVNGEGGEPVSGGRDPGGPER